MCADFQIDDNPALIFPNSAFPAPEHQKENRLSSYENMSFNLILQLGNDDVVRSGPFEL
jgi:hypothetical protein